MIFALRGREISLISVQELVSTDPAISFLSALSKALEWFLHLCALTVSHKHNASSEARLQVFFWMLSFNIWYPFRSCNRKVSPAIIRSKIDYSLIPAFLKYCVVLCGFTISTYDRKIRLGFMAQTDNICPSSSSKLLFHTEHCDKFVANTLDTVHKNVV